MPADREGATVAAGSLGGVHTPTAILLRSSDVTKRIHRLVFCAGDSLGAIGGLAVLKEDCGLSADVLAGIVGSSPLARQELAQKIDLTVFDTLAVDTNAIAALVQ